MKKNYIVFALVIALVVVLYLYLNKSKTESKINPKVVSKPTISTKPTITTNKNIDLQNKPLNNYVEQNELGAKKELYNNPESNLESGSYSETVKTNPITTNTPTPGWKKQDLELVAYI